MFCYAKKLKVGDSPMSVGIMLLNIYKIYPESPTVLALAQLFRDCPGISSMAGHGQQ